MTNEATRSEYSVLITDDEHLAKREVLREACSIALFVPEGEGDIAERIFCSDTLLIDMLSDHSGFCLDRRMGELLVFSSEMKEANAIQELEVILPPFKTIRRFFYAGIMDWDDDDRGSFFGIGVP